MFSVRIVTTDHYQAAPVAGLDVCHNEARNADVYQVPVIRVYGATPAGQKTCMHVHGVFPYLYVPYDGTRPVDRFLRQFAASVDKALNVAMGRASSSTLHVYKVSLVSGILFYGYHAEEETFIKIYLYNPLMVKKAADLLLGGAVMNKIYQPYESHIPYLLQTFIDYNLYGMNMLNVGAVKFRRSNKNDNDRHGDASPALTPPSPGSSFASLDNNSFLSNSPSIAEWKEEDIPSDLFLDESVTRQSTCELEVDVTAADILNRLEVKDNIGSNPGLTALWEDERQRRHEKDLPLNLSPPNSPDRGQVPWTPAEDDLQSRLSEIMQDLKPFLSDDEEGTPGDLTPTSAQQSQLFPSTPASEIDLHLSQATSGGSSPSTLILDEDDEDDAAVINEQSILRVVSSSQSFREDQLIGGSPDESLARLLVALAEDNDESPAASQVAAAAHVSAMEEQDSILSPRSSGESRPGNTQVIPETDSEEERETLEMSQRLWADEVAKAEEAGDSDLVQYDLEGMDESWNDSQWQEAEDSDSGSSDVIPQLDGPVDEATKRNIRKAGRSTILPLGSFMFRAENYNAKPQAKVVNGGPKTADPKKLKGPPQHPEGYYQFGQAKNKRLKMSIDLSGTQLVERQSPKAIVREPQTVPPPTHFVQEFYPQTYPEEQPPVGLDNIEVVEAPVEGQPIFEIFTTAEVEQQEPVPTEQSTEVEPEQYTRTEVRPQAKTPVQKFTRVVVKKQTPKTPFDFDAEQPESAEAFRTTRTIRKKTAKDAPKPPRKIVAPSKPAVLPEEEQQPNEPMETETPPKSQPKPKRKTPKKKIVQQEQPSEAQDALQTPKTKTIIRSVSPKPSPQPLHGSPEVQKSGIKTAVSPSVAINPGHAFKRITRVEVGRRQFPVVRKEQSLDLRSAFSPSKPSPPSKQKSKDWDSAISGIDQSPQKSKAPTPVIKTKSQTPKSGEIQPTKKGSNKVGVPTKKARSKGVKQSGPAQPAVMEGTPQSTKGTRLRSKASPTKEGGSSKSVSPERGNIFSKLAQKLPEKSQIEPPPQPEESRSSPEKVLGKSGTAKIVKGLLGIKKNLQKQGQKSGTQSAASADEDPSKAGKAEDADAIANIWKQGKTDEQSQKLAQEWMEKNKVKTVRRRRRVKSAGSSRGNRTGSEREMSDGELDPTAFIVTQRGSSDSSADSDSDVELKIHVGAHKKTYEKPSFRVGAADVENAGSSKKFDEIIKKTSDSEQDEGVEADVEMDEAERYVKTTENTPTKIISKAQSSGSKVQVEKLPEESPAAETAQEPSEPAPPTLELMVPVQKKSPYRGLRGKPSRLPQSKIDANRTLVTKTSPMKYRQGKYTGGADMETPTVVSSVHVLKEDLKEHDFEQVGSENVVLWKMNDDEVTELRTQVKKEMEHKRTEHIMPLIMQKSDREIEKEYEQVKRRVLEEIAKEPPMDDYVDSDLEPLDESDEKPNSEKDVKPSKVEECNRSGRSSKEVSDEASRMSTDDEMPVLESAYKDDIIAPRREEDMEEEGDQRIDSPVAEHVDDSGVTYVVMSKEEVENLQHSESTTASDPQDKDFDDAEESVKDEDEANDAKEEIVIIDLDAQGRRAGQKASEVVESSESQIELQTDLKTDGKQEGDSLKSTDKQESDSLKSADSKSSRAASRRSSTEMNTDKGDMAEVDFSLLEMDTDNEVAESSMQGVDLDAQRQLDTPPIQIDSDLGQSENVPTTPSKEEEEPLSNETSMLLSSSYENQERKSAERSLKGISGEESDGSASTSQEFTSIKSTTSSPQRKRRTFEQSDHYRFRDKRLNVDYSSGAFVRAINEGHHPPASSSPTRKRPRINIDSEKLSTPEIERDRTTEGDDSESDETKTQASYSTQIKPVKIVVERLRMDDVTLGSRTSRKRSGSTAEDCTEDDSQEGSSKGIVTDLLTEDPVDPLWEAQKQRLAVLSPEKRPQTAKRQKGPPSKGPPTATTDEETAAPKPKSPRKKLKGPYVRRAKKRPDQRKFFDKLSLLHQYTLDSLTSKEGSEGQGSDVGSSESNTGSGNVSPSPTQPKESNPTYSKSVEDDHKAEYDDVMFKLALLSPPDEESQDKSPPQAVSPTQQDNEGSLDDSIDKDVTRHESAGGTLMQLAQATTDALVDEAVLPESCSPTTSKEAVPYSVKTEVVRISSNGPPVVDNNTPDELREETATPPPDLGPPQIIDKSPELPPELEISPPKLSSEAASLQRADGDNDDTSRAPSLERCAQETSDYVADGYAELASLSVSNEEAKKSVDKPSDQTSTEVTEPNDEPPALDEASTVDSIFGGFKQHSDDHIPGIYSPPRSSRHSSDAETPNAQATKNCDISPPDAEAEKPPPILEAEKETASGTAESKQDVASSAQLKADVPSKPATSKVIRCVDDPRSPSPQPEPQPLQEPLKDLPPTSPISAPNSPDDSPGEPPSPSETAAPPTLTLIPSSPLPLDSPSPPRSPSPVQSPEMPVTTEAGHTPAVIPLTIEDPVIQEEVEKARRYKLMKLLGQVPPRSHKSRQIQRMLLKEKLPPPSAAPSDATGDKQSTSQTHTQPTAPSASQASSSTPEQSLSQRLGGDEGAESPTSPPPGQMNPAGSPSEGPSSVVLQPLAPPPSREDILQSAGDHGVGEYQGQEAYCSQPEDVPDRPR